MNEIISNDYIELVKQAKFFYAKSLLFRLKIAQLAVKACTIRHGGISHSYYTLKDFHADTGVPYKALQEWVTTYNTVGKHILSSIKTDEDWTNATKVARDLGKLRAIENRNNKTEKSKAIFNQNLNNPNVEEIYALFEKKQNKDTYITNLYESLKTALYNAKQCRAIDSIDLRLLTETNQMIDELSNELDFIDIKVKKLIKEYYESSTKIVK